MRIPYKIYKRLPYWATRAVDAYQIWDAQLGGWLSRMIAIAAGFVGTIWTYLGESWLPMAGVAGAGLYIFVYKVMADSAHAPDNEAFVRAKASVAEDGALCDPEPSIIRNEQSKSLASEQLPEQNNHTTTTHDQALEQLIRMYILPSSSLLRSMAVVVMVASKELPDGEFYYSFIDKKLPRIIKIEIELQYSMSSAQEDNILHILNEYDEVKKFMDHIVHLLSPNHNVNQRYIEWKQADIKFKTKLTAFASSRREYNKIYNVLEELKWIVA